MTSYHYHCHRTGRQRDVPLTSSWSYSHCRAPTTVPCMKKRRTLCSPPHHLAAAVKAGPTQSVRKNFVTQFACVTVLATAAVVGFPQGHGRLAAVRCAAAPERGPASRGGGNAPGLLEPGYSCQQRSGCQNHTSTSLTWRGSSVQHRRQAWPRRRRRPGCCLGVKTQAVIDSYMLTGSSEGEICVLVLPT